MSYTSTETETKIRRYLRQGYKKPWIAKRLGVGVNLIKEIADGNFTSRRRVVKDEDLVKIREEFRQGATYAVLAAKWKVSLPTIQAVVNGYGTYSGL